MYLSVYGPLNTLSACVAKISHDWGYKQLPKLNNSAEADLKFHGHARLHESLCLGNFTEMQSPESVAQPNCRA